MDPGGPAPGTLRADVALAAVAAQLRAENAAIRQGAAERTVIDRAAGLLAGHAGCPVDEAHDALVRRARREHRRLVDVAQAFLNLWPTGDRPGGAEAGGTRGDAAGAPRAEPAGADGDETAAQGDETGGSNGHDPVLSSTDPGQLAYRLRAALHAAVGAGAVLAHVLEPEGSLREVANAGLPARLASQWRWVPAAVASPAQAAARDGQPQWLPDVDAAARRYPVVIDAGRAWPSRVWLPVEGADGTVLVVGVFWDRPEQFGPDTRSTVRRLVEPAGRRLAELITCAAEGDFELGAGTVQTVFDLVPGAMVLITPVRDGDGQIVDYRIRAATPEASDQASRRGRRLVGQRVLEAYPTTADGELWDLYLHVLATGEPGELGPYLHVERAGGRTATRTYYFQVQRFGPGLLVRFIEHDGEDRELARLERIQRLGTLGWVEADLLTGAVEWSSYLYQLFGRDPADGPMEAEELARLVDPADLPAVKVTIAGLLTGSPSADIRFRVRVRGGVRDIRVIVQVARDAGGRPATLSGLVQDVTDVVQTKLRLEEVEQQLADRQRNLDAEHRLAGELRQIILPLPAAPLSLPGLQVAVRYLPAERAALVGGDWYHASALPDGTVLLAVGDVAGHGLAAAATMAELRHALVGLTVTTADPAELLGYLNRMLCSREDDLPRTATAVIARFDWANTTLTWAQAGHPAPLLVRAGTPSRLPRPRGTLLGAHPASRYATDRLTLTADDVLLLFTDGLTEPHGGGPDERLGDVVVSLLASLAEGTDCSLTDLLRRLPPANPADDTCIMVARATTPS